MQKNIKLKSIQTNGNEYRINTETEKKIKKILTNAKKEFTQPYLYHFTCHIYNHNLFNQKRLLEDLKRKLSNEYRSYFKQKLKQKYLPVQKAKSCPNFICFYSIEFKKETHSKIRGEYYKTDLYTEDYLHIHIYIVFDVVQGYIPTSIAGFVSNALNNISGLRNAQYCKRKNGMLYHNLNKEFDDAVLRASYLAKTDQKSSEIPFRKTFGHTRLKQAADTA